MAKVATYNLLARAGPFCGEGFVQSPDEVSEFLRENCRILVIGAGGLGCELLKDLALMGFGNLDVIDMDTIDVSNLNRQFLFRAKDVGRYKAEVAAEFVERRVPGVRVRAHKFAIEEAEKWYLDEARSRGEEPDPPSFYEQFRIVISGLDNVNARRWMNAKLFSLITRDEDGEVDPGSVVPFIDGGTEGFKGQARVFMPPTTCCFDCALDAFPPQINVPACTIASKPRKPEHCIMWAMDKAWPEVFSRPIDKDAVEDVKWIMERAIARGADYGIEGISYALTQGVMKNIIPAIASTNAIVAAACAAEAFKVASAAARRLDNWMQYIADGGLSVHVFSYAINPACLVCSQAAVPVRVSLDMTLEALRDLLAADKVLQLRDCGLRANGDYLYSNSMALAASLAPNLAKTLAELGLQDGTIVLVSSPALPVMQAIQIRLVAV